MEEKITARQVGRVDFGSFDNSEQMSSQVCVKDIYIYITESIIIKYGNFGGHGLY